MGMYKANYEGIFFGILFIYNVFNTYTVSLSVSPVNFSVLNMFLFQIMHSTEFRQYFTILSRTF